MFDASHFIEELLISAAMLAGTVFFPCGGHRGDSGDVLLPQ